MKRSARVASVVGLTAFAVLGLSAPAGAAPTKSCNGDLHTNLWNVSAVKTNGDIPGQVVQETAHRDHGLGGVLGWWGPFAANVLCKG